MAVINKISIRGIRSFSPDREQAIEFFSPLTMIVGENGSGKTTIIECLKLASTGSLPPGSRSGQAFIHDPKISGVTDVKASIKLRFKAKSGQVMVVVRSFQLTQKRTNLTFKALDGVVRTKDEEKGENISISHKCSELDKQVPTYMGVSAAILENVIFCHQEESSWPLQEGAVVKKKFDDIFESSRYTKALDSIKKTKQEMASKVKDMKADLEALRAHKHAAENLQNDYDRLKEQQDSIKQELSAIDERIAELETQGEEYRARSTELGKLLTRRAEIRTRMGELDAVIKDKARSLGKEREGSDEELQQQLQDFGKNEAKTEAERMKLEAKIQKLSDEIKRLADTGDELLREQGATTGRLEEEGRLIQERDRTLSTLADRYGIFAGGSGGQSTGATPAASQFSDGDVAQFSSALQKQLRERQQELEEKRETGRAQRDSLQSEIRKLDAEKTRIDASVGAKEQELKSTQNDMQGLSAQLQRQRPLMQGQLDEAKRVAEVARADLEKFEQTNQKRGLEVRLEEIKKELANLSVDMERDKRALDLHRSSMDDQNKEAQLRHQVKDDQERLESRVRDVSDRISKIIDGPLQSGSAPELERALEEAQDMLRQRSDDVRQLRLQATNLQRALAEKEVMLTQHRTERSRLEGANAESSTALADIREVIRKINRDHEQQPAADEDIDDSKGPDVSFAPRTYREDEAAEVLEDVKRRETIQMEASVKSVKISEFVEKFVQKGLSAGRCMACRHVFNGDEDPAMIAYKAFGDKRVNQGQQQASEVQKKVLDMLRDQKRILEKNLPAWRAWRERQPLLEEARKEVTAAESAATTAKDAFAAAEATVEDGQGKEVDVRDAVGSIRQLLDEANRIKSLEDNAETIKSRINSYVPGTDERPHETVQRDYDEGQARKERLQAERDEKNQQLISLSQTSLRLHNKKNSLESGYNSLKEAFERETTLKKRRDELKAKMEVLEREVAELKVKDAPLRRELKAKGAEFGRLVAQGRQEDDELGKAVRDCDSAVRDFDAVNRRVEASLRLNHRATLLKMEERLAGNKRLFDDRSCERANMEIAINKIDVEKESHVEQRKLIEAHIDLRKMRKELTSRQEQINTLEAEMNKLRRGEDISRKLEEINQETAKFREKRAGKLGRGQTLKEQMRECQGKLRTTVYVDVANRCRLKQQEYTTNDLAVHDLEKYWTALDKALLRYHSMKIADINKIIADLWQTVYAGQDIDMIEIVSGEEGESTRARRSYNYRVVMRKSGTSLDMKGRCSAGQRVLASLVIRLALAETFCINCGILALDEPTTNLDHNNKRGLADALAKIIASRQRQQNFQLVVITHDDDFVTTMRDQLLAHAGISMPEYYYTISREELGSGKFYSRIDRHDWDELQQG